MKGLKELIYLSVFLIMLNLASAATIHGTIYDIALEKQTDVKVSVNSNPEQFFISKDGNYSFNLPLGDYTIKAEGSEGFAEENISVKSEGDYFLDLILFPDLEEPSIESLNESDFNLAQKNNYNYFWMIAIAVVLIIILALIYILTKKSKKHEEKQENPKEEKIEKQDKYISKVLEILKKNEGRITQKDLRKEIPLSEAKISLIITELEHEGKVKKIKKGRGNVIILNKK